MVHKKIFFIHAFLWVICCILLSLVYFNCSTSSKVFDDNAFISAMEIYRLPDRSRIDIVDLPKNSQEIVYFIIETRIPVFEFKNDSFIDSIQKINHIIASDYPEYKDRKLINLKDLKVVKTENGCGGYNETMNEFMYANLTLNDVNIVTILLYCAEIYGIREIGITDSGQIVISEPLIMVTSFDEDTKTWKCKPIRNFVIGSTPEYIIDFPKQREKISNMSIKILPYNENL